MGSEMCIRDRVYVVQSVVLTQYAIKKSVEVETLMTSVERVMTYTETILELISEILTYYYITNIMGDKLLLNFGAKFQR